MCQRCGDILREDLRKRSPDEIHVTVWGVTDPSKKPIRAVRLPSADDPRLLAGEFAAIVFCDHFLVDNFCVEVFGDDRFNSCGYAVPTPHGSERISCEPPLDFATWCYGHLADKYADTDLTDAYERAMGNGGVLHQPEDKAFANKLTGMDMKKPIHADALARDLLNFALSTSEEVENGCGQNFYVESMILKLFAVDFVLHLRTQANPMLEIVRGKFNSGIDKFCESRPELAGLDELIAERFQKYAEACGKVHAAKEKDPSKLIPYAVGKAFSGFVKGREIKDALESTINDWLFWTTCRDLAAILEGCNVTLSEEEPDTEVN
jgi:hypothetical protein